MIPISTKPRQVNAIVDYIVERDSRKCGIVGIVVFGSRALGLASRDSDWDLLVMCSNNVNLYNVYEKKGSTNIDVVYVPVDIVDYLADQVLEKTSNNTWLTYTIVLKALIDGVIVWDPLGLISYYKRRISKWKWNISDIRLLLELVNSNIESVMSHNILEKVLGLRATTRLLIIGYSMIRQDIIEHTPEWYYTYSGIHGLRELLVSVEGLDGCSRSYAKKLVDVLEGINARELLPKDMDKARRYLDKGLIELSILYSRRLLMRYAKATFNTRYTLFNAAAIARALKRLVKIVGLENLDYIVGAHANNYLSLIKQISEEIRRFKSIISISYKSTMPLL